MYPPNNAYPKCSAPPQPTAPQPAPPQFQNQSTGISICTPMQIQYLAPGPWSTGLCHCCDDVTNCCITCWCPCITFGQIAEIVDRGTTSCATSGALYALIRFLTGCSCVYSCCYRTKMRGQYFLSESPCADCFVHCCCELCALCQEYRELKNRGFDMSLGWHGSLLRQNCAVTVPPAMVPGMNRVSHLFEAH